MSDTQPAETSAPIIPPQDELPLRWEIELEFVQSLANTQYLSYLAQQGYFKDETFINYLRYLTYWKDPKYSKFLVYPNCLHILSMLQNERFRIDVQNQNFTNLLYTDMVEYWREPLFKAEKEMELEKKKETEKDKQKDHDEKETKPVDISKTDNNHADNGDVTMANDGSTDLTRASGPVDPIEEIQPPAEASKGKLSSASPVSDMSSASPQ